MSGLKTISVLAGIALLASVGRAAPFTAGDLVINRSGNGTTALSSASAAVSVVELTTSGGNPAGGANVIAVPNFSTANQGGLTDGGSSGTQGEMTLSANGQYIALSGYDAPVGTASITSSTPAADNRNIAQIDAFGNVTIVARLTDAFSAGNTRSPLTDTGSGTSGGYYVAGNQDFRWANTASGVPTTSSSIYGTQNLEVGQLEVDSAWNKFLVIGSAKTSPWISYFTGFPTTTTATPTTIFGGTTLSAPTGFAFLDVDGNASTGGLGGLDTVYVADGTIKKFVWNGTAWTAAGSVAEIGGSAYTSLAARIVGLNVEIYATSAPASNNSLYKIVDASGYGGTITATASSIASAGTDYAFRGVTFVPSPVKLSSSGTLAALTTSAGVASSPTSFSVSASSGLTGNVTVIAPSGFQVSTSSGSGYAGSITLSESGGALASTTVYVRLPASDAVGTYSGNVVATSVGVAALYVATASSSVTGAVPTVTISGTPSAVSGTYGTASSPTSVSVSGSNLTANITVTAPSGFEVSTTAGSGYSGTVTLTESGGTVASTTVYARLTAADAAGAYSGSLSAASTGATTQTAAIPSSTVSQLALTISGAAVTTKPYDGTTAAVITGTLSGVLSGDVGNVTLDGTGTFAQSADGTGIAVTSTSTITGSAAPNYTLTQPTGLTGTITPSANLGGLALSAGSQMLAYAPGFAAGTTSYSLSVAHTVSSLTLAPTADTGSTVTVNGNSPGTPVSLNPGVNTVTISVTNGGLMQTYTLTVTQLQPFTPGNVVIESIGNSTATTLTMYELATGAANANQTPVQTFAVPSTGASALRQSNAGTTARLGTTNDGTLMAFTGFEDGTGILNGSPVTDETAIAQRGVATLDVNYQYTLQASYTSTTATGDQVRTGTSLNDTVWYMDDKSGIYLAGGTSPTNGTNCVVVKSFGGAVYALSQKASNLLSTLSTDGVTLTGLSGLPSDANAVDYYLLSSGTQGNLFDILYVLDGTTVSKYSYSQGSSTWSINGAATNIGGATGIGMCAVSTGTGATLYITTENAAGTSGTVLQLSDTAGYGAAPAITTANNVVLYNSSAFLKGVSFVPLASALPDLTVGVTAPTLVGSGSNFVYTILAANSGAASASGVSVQFTLPSGLTFVSAADTGSAGFAAVNNNGVVTFSGGSLAANATETLTVTVNGPDSTYVVDAGASPAQGHGSASIGTTGSETNTANDVPNLGLTTHVGNSADLTIGVSGSSTAVANSGGSPVTYTLTAQNIGNESATGVGVQFTLPSGLVFVSAVDNGGAGFTAVNSGSLVTFSGGTIAGGASETLTVTAVASDSTYRIFNVELPPGAAVATAGNISGSASSSQTVITSVTLPSGADLALTSTPNGPFLAGDSADTFTVYVSNDGTAATSGTVTVTDALPSGLTPLASMNGATVNGWTLAVSGQTVTATRSDVLNCGATYPAVAAGLNYYPALTITFSVGSGASGALSNSVSVSGGGDVFAANGSVTNAVNIGTPSAISTAGNLIVSRAHYTGAAITAGATVLPNGATAVVSAAYPQVWQNEGVDESFGVAAPIYLDVINRSTGALITSTNLTSLIQSQLGINLATSFSSKSEVGLSLTPDGTGLTLSGYIAPPGQLDVSNANTLYHDDPTCLIAANGDFQKGIVQVDYRGNVSVTANNSYSGDNCRAAVLGIATDGNSYYYTAGSAGNSGANVTGTTMTMLAQCTGIQMVLPGAGGQMTAVGEAFGTANSSTGYQLGYAGQPGDKTGKDMNLRSLTLNPYNNTLYTSKGSGGSGVDTVYQIGSGAIPTASSASSIVYTIAPGFPTASGTDYPFGIWFANAYTMYVADEGAPSIPTASNYAGGVYTQAIPANNPSAGLQKWINSAQDGSGTWSLVYTLKNGLNLGVPYAYTIANYATGVNPATGVPWQPANNGLRNITGQINGDGTVTIYAVTSTISGETDEGADPNQLVSITDNLAATALPGSEAFSVLMEATGLDAIRGVALSMPNSPNLAASFSSAGIAAVTADGYNATGITLDPVTLGFAPTAGQVLTLVDNTSSSPIVGTFASLPQGGTVTGTFAGTSYTFTISYVGGGGNSITLTAQAQSGGGPSNNDTDTPAMPAWGYAVLAGLLLVLGSAFAGKHRPARS